MCARIWWRHPWTLSLACAARHRSTRPGGVYEPELEQGDADWKSRERSRGPLDHGREPRGDVLARDEPVVERRERHEAGEDGVAPLRGVEHEELAARRHRREVREEGRQAVRRGPDRVSPVAGPVSYTHLRAH